MTRGVGAAFVLLAALALTNVATRSGASNLATCRPHTAKTEGGTVKVFCNATATVTVGGRTVTFTRGECELWPKYVSFASLTARVGGRDKPGRFDLLVGKHPGAAAGDPAAAKDGTYRRGLINVSAPPGLPPNVSVFNGKALRITLTNGRRRGTFSGSPAFGKPIKVSGRFRC